MDNFAGNHFQDYSITSPAPNSDVYLYNRPQAAGNRGIACIAFAIVDGRGNAVLQMNWPRPVAKTDPGDMLSVGDFESFIQTNLYEADREPSNKKRPGFNRFVNSVSVIIMFCFCFSRTNGASRVSYLGTRTHQL